jgi:hypothetical protein
MCAEIVVGMQNVEVDGSCSVWDEVQGDLPVGANNRVAQDGHSRCGCHRDVNAVGKGVSHKLFVMLTLYQPLSLP